MVVLFHAPLAVPGKGVFFVVSVDMFFSLSGYLIMQMIFERFNMISSRRDFALFMLNRWIRTFPLYYIFVGVNVALVAAAPLLRDHYPGPLTGTTAVPNLLPFFVFLQNVTEGSARYDNWFSVSWSLAIEEWFYLLLALTLLLLPARAKAAYRTWWIGGMVLALGMLVARSLVVACVDQGTFSLANGYRGVLLLRADAFVYGGAIYLWQRCRPAMSAARAARTNLAAAGLGVLLLAASWLLWRASPDGAWTKVLLPSAAPLGAALLLPCAAALPLPRRGAAAAVIVFLSTRTYAIYLAHIPIQYVFFSLLAPAAYSYGLFLIVLAAVSHVLYVYVERPIMARRPLSGGRAQSIMPVPPPLDMGRLAVPDTSARP